MYRPPADAAELAYLGLTPADIGEDEDIEVWPENMEPVLLFNELGTQWRGGVGAGLDYGPLFTRLAFRCGSDSERYERLFQDVRVLESAAMAAAQDKPGD